MIVAIDGPSGSGKGTIAKKLGKLCGLTYIDTGATYRALALEVLEKKIDLSSISDIIDMASKLDVKFTSEGLTILNGKDVSNLIRTTEISAAASIVSAIPEVRKYMVDLQKNMAASGDVIMEGRDITTVVFPNADYKFYLDASVDVRALRRHKQNLEAGMESDLEKIKEAIIKRDYNDTHKEVGSLMRTEDQIYIDSSNMSIDEVIEYIRKVIGR